MGWKKLPYWLKGGLIGIIISIILILVNYIFILLEANLPDYITTPLFLLVQFVLLTNPLTYLFWGFGGFYGSNVWFNFTKILFLSSISFFIIGALIGFIISKFKSKK